MLQIRLLGQFELRRDDTPLVIHSRAAQSLLAFLLLNAGTTQRRERLAGLLWPDLPEENARNNLRRELWRLRKVIHVEGYLLSDDISVTFDAESEYWLDTAVLEQEPDLPRALAVYRGELLPGFYDDWVSLERERLRGVFEKKSARLLECLEAERRWAELQELAEHWIALGQSPEPAYRALMIVHAACGDRAQVAAVYQRCVQALQKDLGVEPSEQTRALFERLRAGQPQFSPAPLLPASLPDAPPYKGLRYFDEGDAALFYGRERLIDVLVGHLDEHHWLTVVGASGSGKSSLVRAGLVPTLKARNRDWVTLVLTPTAHPLEMLATLLTRGTESTTATTALVDDMAHDAHALCIHLDKTTAETKRRLLVIDQFEELFTLCGDEQERASFINNLLLATAPELDRPIYVVVALRADLYAQCAAYASLREALSQRQEYIGPMTLDEMRRAIERPAERGLWELEPGLVELILRDVGNEPGTLPLLSHALLETWKRRRGRVLTLEGYANCGGVRGAIAQTAETVFHQLSPEEQDLARHVFLQLTELGEGTPDTRRRMALAELGSAADHSQVREVLRTLADARLVTLGEDTVEVAHEALIREWSRLREWLNQNREALQFHRRLSNAAQAWGKSNRDPSELYRGARLAQALEWAKTNPSDLNPLEREFLDASTEMREREEAEREAQRQRELLAAQQLAEAERRQRDVAEKAQADAEYQRQVAFTRELSVNAVNNLTIDPERSILLALQAISVSSAGDKPVLREAEEALHRAVQASRVQLTLRGHTAGLNDVAFSPDGKRLATASNDKSAKIWDRATGQELLTLCSHTDVVWKVAFSPDGKRLATASGDKTAKVWDTATGKELLTLRGHTDVIMGITFNPDGTRIATSSYDKTAKVWDSTTAKELVTLIGHTGGVSRIAFSPDGARLATASWIDELEHTTKVWDATTGKLLITLIGHISGIWSVAFSPDGKRLATGSGDATAKIWDATSGQLLMTIFPHSIAHSVAFSPNGTRVVTGNTNGLAQVWNAATGELLLTLAGHATTIFGVCFSPDETRLATASVDGTAKVWDSSTEGSREWLTIAGHTLQARYIAYSPDGTRVATAGQDKIAKVWDAVTGKELLTLAGHRDAVNGIAFSPDGSRLATVSLDQTARVWDAATGKQLLRISTKIFLFPQGPRVAFSPDGKRIVTPGAENTAKVWDAVTGKELLTLCCHTSHVWAVAFSPDGTHLATGSWDHTAKVWDSTTGKELLTLSGHTDMLLAVKYSPDGQRIATASMDGKAKVWDTTTGEVLLTLSGQTGSIVDVDFSPDGTRVATASGDGTVKVWDIATAGVRSEQPLTLYNPNGAMVTGVAYSPDGKRLAVSSNDSTARIYALPLNDIISIAKSRLTRALTTDECQKYLHVDDLE